jgi:hypothetical protein
MSTLHEKLAGKKAPETVKVAEAGSPQQMVIDREGVVKLAGALDKIASLSDGEPDINVVEELETAVREAAGRMNLARAS